MQRSRSPHTELGRLAAILDSAPRPCASAANSASGDDAFEKWVRSDAVYTVVDGLAVTATSASDFDADSIAKWRKAVVDTAEDRAVRAVQLLFCCHYRKRAWNLFVDTVVEALINASSLPAPVWLRNAAWVLRAPSAEACLFVLQQLFRDFIRARCHFPQLLQGSSGVRAPELRHFVEHLSAAIAAREEAEAEADESDDGDGKKQTPAAAADFVREAFEELGVDGDDDCVENCFLYQALAKTR